MQHEKIVHSQICEYLKTQYPRIVFNTDSSGIKLTIGQATQLKKLRSHNGFPDITIYEPKKGFSAMFLELKREAEEIYNKKGNLKTEHLKTQSELHEILRSKGFYCCFGVGFDNAKQLIDNYLK